MCSSDAAFIIRPRPSPPAPSAPTTCPTGSCTSTRATGRPWGTRQACKFEIFLAYFNFPTCSRQFSNMVVDCQFRGDDCMVGKIAFLVNLSGALFFSFFPLLIQDESNFYELSVPFYGNCFSFNSALDASSSSENVTILFLEKIKKFHIFVSKTFF